MLQAENLRKTGTLLDYICLIILSIIAFSLINEKYKRKTKLRRIYCLNIAINGMFLIADILSWELYKTADCVGIYSAITYSAIILLCVYEAFNYYMFSVYFKEEKRKSHLIVYVAFLICIVSLMVKDISSKIIYLQNGDWRQGPLFNVFIFVLVSINLGIVFWTIVKRKILGLGNVIAICISLFIQISQGYATTKMDVTYAFFVISMSNLLFYLINYQNKQAELRKAEDEISELKNKMLLSQIKPHFIFNTLSSISSLCIKDPSRARDGIDVFSKYLRNNLEAIDRTTIPFSKELETIKNYIFIQQIRFVDKINVVYDIKVEKFNVASLTILTLVENAVKHGLCLKNEGGTVKISTYDNQTNIYINIEDDGIGFDVRILNELSYDHVGIRNSKVRIENELNGTLNIFSEIGKGTSVNIIIPKVNV